MCIQWARVLYSVVITQQSNPPISQFNSPCNEFTSFWSMFVYNNVIQCIVIMTYIFFTQVLKQGTSIKMMCHNYILKFTRHTRNRIYYKSIQACGSRQKLLLLSQYILINARLLLDLYRLLKFEHFYIKFRITIFKSI